MSEHSIELLHAVQEIRKLLELLAEPAIAQRDAKLRSKLRELVGSSETKRKSVLKMDGTRTQTEIHAETGAHKGNLSTLVKALVVAKLVVINKNCPKLEIAIPSNFFEIEEHE